MTKEEITWYIIDNKMPISFIWENDNKYHMDIRVDNYKLLSEYFPKFIKISHISECKSFKISSYQKTYISVNDLKEYINTNKIFEITKTTLKECLGEFLIWWEINKGRCKSIEYYEK